MSKKNEKSQNGKGDKSRISDKKKYDENYEKIFKVDIGRVDGNGTQLNGKQITRTIDYHYGRVW